MLHAESPLKIEMQDACVSFEYIDETIVLPALPRDHRVPTVSPAQLYTLKEGDRFNLKDIDDHTFENSEPRASFQRVGLRGRTHPR